MSSILLWEKVPTLLRECCGFTCVHVLERHAWSASEAHESISW